MPSVALRKVLIGALAASVVVGLGACAPERPPEPAMTQSVAPTETALPAPVEKTKSFFDKSKYSIDDPLSLWVINNKRRPLNPADYVPPDMVDANVRYITEPEMRPPAAAAIAEMFAASEAEGGGTMQVQNSYRSYASQTRIYNRAVAAYGQAAADSDTARPGYSEHQTGWTADVAAYPSKCDIQECFGDTPQGIWLAANAWRFGFIIRYPQGKADVTGYVYEPWHIRYVGIELSTEMHNDGILTMEEFFGLPPAPDYPQA